MPRPVMRRRSLAWLGLAGGLCVALSMPAPASAQPGATPPAPKEAAASPAPGAAASPAPGAAASAPASPGPSEPSIEDEDTSEDTSSENAARGVAGERELGARLGVAMGRRFTPGGVRVAGVMLYRLSQDDWFDGSMAFTFGRSRTACFMDRNGAFACDYGVIDGTAIDLVAGIRRFLPGPERFAPYLRAGLGVRLLSFGGDDVRGVAIPASAGLGVRARVSDLVAVGADVGAEAGLAWLDHGLGVQSQLGIVLHAMVELWLE
jgi:hypothetical protein